MKNKLEKVVILTANRPRHLYYAQTLYESLDNVLGVFLEDKKVQEKVRDTLSEKSEFVKKHLDDFSKKEKAFFQVNLNIPKEKLFYSHDINKDSEKINNLNPDIVTVFGTTLLKEPLIGDHKTIVNLHLGLSPYYRGNGTNLFAFYNNEPEYIGATIHFLNKKIDAGRIISQVRPDIDPLEDTINTVNCKAIKKGIEEVIRVVRRIQEKGKVPSYIQDTKIGRIYYNRDFTEEVCKKAYKNVAKGLILNYKPKKVEIYSLK
jgi:methionyl-tRNA formyltransferase